MKKDIRTVLFLSVLFLIPYLLIYRAFFTSNTLSWGDAPFFYPEALKELFNMPFVWDIRNINFGGNQSLTLWLFLPTFLFGWLNHFLNLSSPTLIRLIFYFPATILSFVGSYFLINKFLKNTQGSFLGALLYSFNTYFLMLIDGGQIGVSLAYGLFPLTVLFLDNFLAKPNIKNFLFSLIFLFLISNSDLRILVLSLLLNVLILIYKVWREGEKFNKIFYLLIILVCNLSLNLFWFIPFIMAHSNFITLSRSNSQSLFSLVDAFYLYQPHFPLNQFGLLFPLPFYFVFLPFLIFGGFIVSRKKENTIFLFWGILFLLFVFLAKGNNPPLGDYYNFLLTLPLIASFRDSTKFLVPALLSASLLLGFSYDSVKKFSTKKSWMVFLGFYLYILILIYPAFLNQLTGVLNPTENRADYQNIYSFLKKDEDFYRTVWFKEKPPLAYFSWQHPALSAVDLYKDRPFGSMIDGGYDLFNFLHDEHLKDWFNLLGIKYAFFPEDQRQKLVSDKQKIDRKIFTDFIAGLPLFKSLEINANFPSYKIAGSLPHIFAQKKAYFVLGGEDIYQQLFKDPNFKLYNQSFIFLEEGKSDPSILSSINPEDTGLVFFKKDNQDLVMSFLQNKMHSPKEAVSKDWGSLDSSDYLKWKELLLQHGIKTYEFDYGKGINFSTIKGEKIKFKINVPKSNDYLLALRYTNSSEGAGLKVSFAGRKTTLKNFDQDHFKWSILGPFNLSEGPKDLELVNNGGLAVFNTAVLVDKNTYTLLENQTQHLLETIKFNKIYTQQDSQNFGNLLSQQNILVTYQQKNPSQYQVEIPKQASWLVFTDHFDPDWQLKAGNITTALPAYAMVNLFYLRFPQSQEKTQATLLYTPQEKINQGIVLSLSFALLILLISLVTIFLAKRGKNIM